MYFEAHLYLNVPHTNLKISSSKLIIWILRESVQHLLFTVLEPEVKANTQVID